MYIYYDRIQVLHLLNFSIRKRNPLPTIINFCDIKVTIYEKTLVFDKIQ